MDSRTNRRGAVHFADCQDPAYAQNTGEGAVVDLGKVVLVDGEEDVEQLTVGDWALLARAWAGLPPLKLPLREREFEPYRVAFDRYKGYAKPNDFDLSPMVGNMGTDIYLTVRRTIDEHEIELKRWAKEGLVVPRSRSSMVKLPGTWGTGAGLVLDDLRKFAGALQIDVHVAQPDARAKTAADMAAMSDFEQRKYLLGEFRDGGRVFGVDLEKSRSGALSELADRIDRNKSSLYDRLRKAALEEAASG